MSDMVDQFEQVPGSGQSNYASFWIRLLALVIDLVILSIISFITIFLITSLLGLFKSAVVGILASPLIITCVIWLYEAGFQSSTLMATPGKVLCRIVVTDADGNQIDFGSATLRVFCKISIGSVIQVIVPAVGLLVVLYGAIDNLIIVTSKNKRSIHDFIAGTYVIYRDSKVTGQ